MAARHGKALKDLLKRFFGWEKATLFQREGSNPFPLFCTEISDLIHAGGSPLTAPSEMKAVEDGASTAAQERSGVMIKRMTSLRGLSIMLSEHSRINAGERDTSPQAALTGNTAARRSLACHLSKTPNQIE